MKSVFYILAKKGRCEMLTARLLPASLLVVAFLVATTPQVQASIITYTATGNLSLTSGPDTLGLGGASFTFQASFNDTDTYVSRFGFPTMLSFDDSLTISGASVGSTNGTYNEDFGLIFYPTYDGQFYGGPTGGNSARWTVPGGLLELGNLSEPVGGVAVGDAVDVSHFGATEFSGGAAFRVFATSTEYAVDNFSASASVVTVPEPSSLAILGLGGVGLALATTRRIRRTRRAPASIAA